MKELKPPAHQALTRCHQCGAVLPHDVPACACGAIILQPCAPTLCASRLARRLAALAEGIGWTTVDAVRLVARPGTLAMAIDRQRGMRVLVEDVERGITVLDADTGTTLQQAQRLAAGMAAQHVYDMARGGMPYAPTTPAPDVNRIMAALEEMEEQQARRQKELREENGRKAKGFKPRGRLKQMAQECRARGPSPTIIQGPDVPWHRLKVGEPVALDLGDLPPSQRAQETFRQRMLFEDWRAGSMNRAKHLVSMKLIQKMLIIRRTA